MTSKNALKSPLYEAEKTGVTGIRPSAEVTASTASAGFGLFQAYAQVDAVGPDVHVVAGWQVAVHEGGVVGLPGAEQADAACRGCR